MGFPAVAAEGQKITIVSKTWHGDRQLYIDDFGRSWIMGLYGLEIHDGNVPEAAVVVDAAEGDLAAPVAVEEAPVEAEPTPEIETTVVDEDDIPEVIFEDAEPPSEEDVAEVEAFHAEQEAKEAAAPALIDAGGDPWADDPTSVADEAVIPAQPDDPAADA